MPGPEPLRVHALIDSMACGGAEMLLADLAAVAPAAGLSLSVSHLRGLDRSPAVPRLRRAGVDPDLVGIGRLLSPRSAKRVVRHLADHGAELVHTHLGYADVLGGLASRRLGLPWVSTVHAMAWDRTPRERAQTALAFAVRRLVAGRVIVVSESARRAYLARSSIDPARVVVVRNGIVGRRAAGRGRSVRAELGLDPGDSVVVLTAPLRREKGHRLAFAALAALRPRVPRLRALVLGEGPDAGYVSGLAAELGAEVSMLGHRDDVMAVLDAADVVLHTPETDALPTTLIEAGAAGAPVVATATGGIPEIVVDEETGLLVATDSSPATVADAVERVLASPSLRTRLGAAARERFELRFAAEPWARRLRSIYVELLTERGMRA